jgi:hypothetical protein
MPVVFTAPKMRPSNRGSRVTKARRQASKSMSMAWKMGAWAGEVSRFSDTHPATMAVFGRRNARRLGG